MINTQMLEYIKAALAQGISIRDIQHKLLTEGGWDQSDIDQAFSAIGMPQNSATVTISPKPVSQPKPVPPPIQPSQPRPITLSQPTFRPTPPPQPQPITPPEPVLSRLEATPVVKDIQRPVQQIPRPVAPPEPKPYNAPEPVVIQPHSVTPPQPPTPPTPMVSQMPVPPPIQPSQPRPIVTEPLSTRQPVSVPPQSQSVPIPPALQATPQSHTFATSMAAATAPVVPSRKRGNGWIFILIVIILIAGAGGTYAYVTYFKGTVPPTTNSQSTQNTSDQTVTQATTNEPVNQTPSSQLASDNREQNQYYSYVLPDGWQAATSTAGKGVLASYKSKGYILSAAITPIPSNAGTITSIDQLISSTTVNEIINGEFPGAKLYGLKDSSLGGETAKMITFTSSTTSKNDNGDTVPKLLAMTQYSVVHNGSMYTLVFIVDMSVAKSGNSPDFTSIVNSFQFNQ